MNTEERFNKLEAEIASLKAIMNDVNVKADRMVLMTKKGLDKLEGM